MILFFLQVGEILWHIWRKDLRWHRFTCDVRIVTRFKSVWDGNSKCYVCVCIEEVYEDKPLLAFYSSHSLLLRSWLKGIGGGKSCFAKSGVWMLKSNFLFCSTKTWSSCVQRIGFRLYELCFSPLFLVLEFVTGI